MSKITNENIGIRVTPCNTNAPPIPRSVLSSCVLNVEDDEAYYEAHPPASGLLTLIFFNANIANQSPINPENYQLIA
jgi:hypothetical protein